MAKLNLYAWVKINEHNLIYVDPVMCQLESDIKERYESHVSFVKENRGENARCETFEGFKLTYVFLTVEYDGRKKSINEQDIVKAMEKAGYAQNTGNSNIFGDTYKATDELKNLLAAQLHKRKVMAGLIKEDKTAV